MSQHLWSGRSVSSLRLRGDEGILLAFALLWTAFWSAYLQAAYSAGVPTVMWAVAMVFIAYGAWSFLQTLRATRKRLGHAYAIHPEALEVTDVRTGEVIRRLERASMSELTVEVHRGGLVTLWCQIDGAPPEPVLEMVEDGHTAATLLGPAPNLSG